MAVPEVRIRTANARPVQRDGAYVLYWMVASRRLVHSFPLDRAIEHAKALSLPLVILEALRSDHPFASDRLHAFQLQGMAQNAARAAKAPVTYLPYVERERGEGKGLLAALGARAAVVVTDDWPSYFVPHMIAAAASRLEVRLEAVDGNGLYPLHATPRVFPSAHLFRQHLARELRPHLEARPSPGPLSRLALPALERLPAGVTRRWRAASPELLAASPRALAALPIDHGVPVAAMAGGPAEGAKVLARFVAERLESYAERRDDPAVDGTSRLSPYLHFGHVGIHQVLHALEARERALGRELRVRRQAFRRDLFGLSEEAEVFLDQSVVWRELGFHLAAKREDHARYESLPAWARQTLDRHRPDPRPHLCSAARLEAGDTGDALFDAAQRQLREEGFFHNVARMIWGKKLLEYSAAPEEAYDTLGLLMSRWSLDGRDPCSVTGGSWVFGRYDRPWGPERPIFGTVRYMTSTTPEKLRRYRAYLARYGPARS